MQWIFFFLVYALVGWGAEVAFAAVKHGKFVNRGFLAGPVCPIYGFGVVIVVACLNGLKDNWLLLFLGAVVLTSVLEFVTGFILERFFHKKWWDYSKVPLNIMGYVCLPFSLAWGLGCMGVLYIVHPVVAKLWDIFPFFLHWLVLIPLGVLLADLYYTVSGILKINRIAGRLDELETALGRTSDKLGSNIAEAVFTVRENQEKAKELSKEKSEEMRVRYEELRVRYKELLQKRESRTAARLAKAFPSLQSSELFAAARERMAWLKRYQKQLKNRKK